MDSQGVVNERVYGIDSISGGTQCRSRIRRNLRERVIKSIAGAEMIEAPFCCSGRAVYAMDTARHVRPCAGFRTPARRALHALMRPASENLHTHTTGRKQVHKNPRSIDHCKPGISNLVISTISRISVPKNLFFMTIAFFGPPQWPGRQRPGLSVRYDRNLRADSYG